MTRARQIADFGDGIATADIDDGAVTAAKIGSLPAGSVFQWHGATLSRGPGTNGRCWVTIYRGGTNLGHSTEGMNGADGDGQLINTPMALSYLDSPNTTSEITYSVYFRSNSGATVECPPWGSAKLTLTAMEIAG